ncbi:MAG: O-antigen ligase family protein, partial [Veillonella sp.]|nr:O-antigen ligase family protein [Veillonella sp.]
QSRKWSSIYFILLALFSAMIFLTKARTATTLYFGELVLLLILVAVYYRHFWKRYIATLLASGIGFLLMLLVLMHPTALAGIGSVEVPQEEVVSIEQYSAEYMDQNVKSVVGNSRSNNARSINNWRTAEVALNNPVFGVGVGLQDIYIQDQLRTEDLENEEVRNWTRDLNKQGIIASGYPTTNHFAVTAAQTGIVGLLIYLAPFIFVLWSLVRKHILAKNFTVAALSIGLVGCVVAFMSNMAFFYVYILLGILLCVIDSHTKRA